MAKRIIVNADGFGFTPGVNKGIVESISNGIVRSVSCVVNFPYIEEVANLSKEFPFVSIGVHFNLSVGRPVSKFSEIPTLVNDEGQLWGKDFVKRLMIRKIKTKDMKRELGSQAKVLLDLGITPTHWDGHQNKHLYPPFFFAAMDVAKRYEILRVRTHRRYIFIQDVDRRKEYLVKYYIKNPQRFVTHTIARIMTRAAKANGFRMADRLISPGYADKSWKYLLDTWVSLMKHLPEGTNEIYCHPGYVDEVLRKHARYVYEREHEVKILTSDTIKDVVKSQNIELLSFRHV